MKSGEYSQTERQMMILALLSSSERGYTFEEINRFLNKNYVEVSAKTVERDLDTITDSFYIYEEDRNGKTYFIANKYKIDPLQFDTLEMIALYFAREVLRNYEGIDLGASALNILNKIIGKMPTMNKAYIESLRNAYRVYDSDILREKNIKPEVLEEIRMAMNGNRRIEIKYHSFHKDQDTVRVVDPYFMEIQDGGYHMFGYCHLRKECRVFRISRIEEVKTLKDVFQRPEDLQGNLSRMRFDKLTGSNPEELVLLFKKSKARYIMEYESFRAEKVEELSGGQLLFTRTVPITDDVEKWVLGFGAEVKVLEPKSLALRMKAAAKEMIALYEKENENDA